MIKARRKLIEVAQPKNTARAAGKQSTAR